MNESTARRAVLVLALVLIVIGAALVWSGGYHSKRLTGEWLGYPLPDKAAVALGIGILASILGVLLVGAYGILVVAELTGVRRLLGRTVLDDAHPVARFGAMVLRAHRAWEAIVGVLLLVAVSWAALHDRLMAAILGVTGLLIVVLYCIGRRWPHRE